MLDLILNTENDEKLSLYEKLLESTSDLIFKFTLTIKNQLFIDYTSKNLSSYFELDIKKNTNDGLALLQQIICREDFAPLIISAKLAVTNLEENWKYQFRTIENQKETKWFSIHSTIKKIGDEYHFYGNTKNITAFKNQEEKARFSEERYQFALDASSEGIWDLDVEKNLVYFSSQSMKMIGFEEKDTIISRDFWDNRIHPEDKHKYLQDFEDHINEHKPYYKNLQRILTKDNGYKYILSKGRVIERDLQMNPKRIIGTHSDISAHREKEIQIKKTLEILSEQNQRLNNFAHIVSHNLRSHAGNFKMLLDIIDKETDPSILKECMTHLKTNSIELSETISNLKDLVEIQSNLKPTKVPLNLSYYLNKVLNTLSEELIKHDVDIFIKIPKNTTVDFNPAYLESILLNFTTNAIKYSKPEINPRIEYHFSEDNELTIKDNGLGIDLKKHGNSLFGMYKTFHKHPNSRGIGLFISKNQIESMGGSITVESTVGEGSNFKIKFNE